MSMKKKNNDLNCDSKSVTNSFDDPEMWTLDNLEKFYTTQHAPNSYQAPFVDPNLVNQNIGLHWDLVDAQMDANRLARMYLELCEAAAPWMGQIQENRENSVRFTQTDGEAAMYRPELKDQPRIRHENPQVLTGDEVNWDSVYPAPSSAGSVAVHLHLYYVDLSEEFISFFKNIPFPFDLYISCRLDADPMQICRDFSVLDMAQSIIVRKSQNRGRDIAPLYVLFREEVARHDYFLHVHSKKSLFTGSEQVEWRTSSLQALCGSELQVRKVFGALQCHRNVGLLFPETVKTMHFFAHTWLQNEHHIERLSKDLGFTVSESIFNYPVGSFFWARTEALRPVFDRAYTYEDFDEEHGQIDGTLAHALERAIAWTARSRCYSLAIVDNDEKILRFDYSHKILRNCFSETLISAKNTLSHFDAVSFDIFDTLITRKLFNPDDLFCLMGKKIEKDYGYRIDYIKYRKKAEQIAWKKKRAYTNIHDIYEELPQLIDISKDVANELKNLEIELELACCIPRKDVQELFNYLRRKNIPIYLVSDMYLTSDIVEKLLKKCGYFGYCELFISCEMGLRKDDSTMWTYLSNTWANKRVIHIGDNLTSDAQRSSDQRIPIYPIMNPRTMFQLSNLYPYLRDKIRTEPAASYTLGMLVNGYLFNSPFALESKDRIRLRDLDAAAKALFGPTLLSFLQTIPQYTQEGQQLLFLSREGHFLHQLYKTYYDLTNRRKNPSCYFLASRRATSVAAIKSKSEIKQIMQDYYRGTLGNLLNTRLGIQVPNGPDQLQVSLPEQTNAVMELLENHIDSLLEKSKTECDLYNRYAQSVLSADAKLRPVVIDLGYSGTIQYYLSLVLNQKIDGFYLYTGPRKKPLSLGCSCQSLFSKDTDSLGLAIMDNSLYLESILQAPHGQVLGFKEDKTAPTGISVLYRKEDMPPKEIFTMQQSVLNYATEHAAFEKILGFTVDLDPELAVRTFTGIMQSRILPPEILSVFTVEDFFCGNGIKRVDPNTGTWVPGET